MIKSFGAILRNVLGGVANILTGNSGHAQDFLDWLQKITKEFDKWTKSKKAKEFFDGAVKSADDLWGLIKSIGRVIGAVFFNQDSKNTGDNIIESMTKSLNKFADYLQTPRARRRCTITGSSRLSSWPTRSARSSRTSRT